MILGISESIHPLYFYTDIKSNSEGEIFINYKKGVSKVFVYINNKTEDINKSYNWGKNIPKINPLKNNNNRLIFNSSNSNCPKGCELYIEVIVNEKIDVLYDFSLFFKYTGDNQSPIYILPNEFVFGELNQDEFDNYQILIQKDIKDVEFILECDFCKLKINETEYSGLDKLYKYSNLTSTSLKNQILNITISPNNSLSYPQFYSFKLIIPNTQNIRRITSENIEYCNNNSCLFAIPIKNYENTSNVLLYATNNNYPKYFNPIISYLLVDFDKVESNEEIISGFTATTLMNNFNNIIIEKNNNNVDKYLIIQLISNINYAQISLIISKYPHFSNKNLIPNSAYIIHSQNNNITFNLYGNTLQFIEFININNGGTIKYPNYEDYLISKGNIEYININQNNTFNYTGGENSDILIKYKTSPNNKLNVHYLDLKNNITLRYKNNTYPLLLYFKIPKELYETIISFQINKMTN